MLSLKSLQCFVTLVKTKSFTRTAEELYLDIMKTKPDWLLQIPQYHIASYLGITPETLSRIRKQMASR